MAKLISENEGKTRLSLHVHAGAKKSEIIGIIGERLKIKVASPPVDGSANKEIIRFFAKLIRLRKNQIEITQGEFGKFKVISIDALQEAVVTALHPYLD